MVNEIAKNPGIPASDGTRRASSLETIHHRGRKRSLSAMSSPTKGLLNQQTLTREESDATRLLSKNSIPKPISSTRQSESARLMKLIPDLSQKEMSRLVGAIIRRQKRDVSFTERKPATTRDRSLPRTTHALFPEKNSESARSQTFKVDRPVRLAASTKQDAFQMLRESRTGADQAASSEQRPVSIDQNRIHRNLDLAEELVYRSSPR